VHGHDVNPGCDLDPRDSAPIHLGDDMTALLHQYPNVIAWVAGHSHVNSIEPYPDPNGEGGFWSIRVAAEADWPQQSRLLELFDNGDGTLSIFGTILDHASPATAPAPGSAAAFSVDELAAVGRTLSYNDTQNGGRSCNGGPCGEGGADDRNVELLIDNPLEDVGPGPGSGRCPETITGTAGNDHLVGTAASERILGKGGNDSIAGKGGGDCLRAGRGKDRAAGGGGNDRIGGALGRDRLNGGKGKDRLNGGRGNDRIQATDGERDRVRCGPGHDVARVDEFDRVARSCELVGVAVP
jgi:hypothetical protein